MQALPFSMFIWIRGPFEKVTITLVERSLVTESEEAIVAVYLYVEDLQV